MTRKIILGRGGSNMVGRGALPNSYANAARLFNYTPSYMNPAYTPSQQPNTWCPAKDPLTGYWDGGGFIGVGPLLPCADRLLTLLINDSSLEMGVINTGCGNTNSYDWAPRKAGLLTSSAVRVEQAIAACPGASLAGVLVYQGEGRTGTDQDMQGDAEARWAENQIDALIWTRERFANPLLPFVFIIPDPHNNYPAFPAYDVVQRQAECLRDSGLPNIALVSAKGMQTWGDVSAANPGQYVVGPLDIHLTTASCNIVGHAAADALYAMMAS